MANLLRTCVLRTCLTEAQARKVMFFLSDIPLQTVPAYDEGRQSILDTALSRHLTAYDATYLHLAFMTGAELITNDRDLLNAGEERVAVLRPSEY